MRTVDYRKLLLQKKQKKNNRMYVEFFKVSLAYDD